MIQPNVGRIMDWYKKHPGYIRNQKVSLHFCSSSILASVEQATCKDWHSQASTAGCTNHYYSLTSCESNSLFCKQGPRQDGGSLFDNDNPGVQLAERIYNYCGKYHPKTKVMVAGFRNKAGESNLSECTLFGYLGSIVSLPCLIPRRQYELERKPVHAMQMRLLWQAWTIWCSMSG